MGRHVDAKALKEAANDEAVLRAHGVEIGPDGSGRCAFRDRHSHDDAAPSFYWDRARRRGRCRSQDCFGGWVDIIGFITKLTGCGFHDACRRVAEISGHPLPEAEGQEQAGSPRHRATPRAQRPKDPEAALAEMQSALHGSDLERDLKERRGLTDEVIQRFELGAYHVQVVIPFRDDTGKLVGYKVHKGPHLRADGTKAAKGEGIKAQLYPRQHLTADPVWIAEGELDVIRLAVEGVQAVTGTAGAGTWKPEWTAHLRGRDVRGVYDNDTAGQDGQQALVRALKGEVKRLRVVRWPEGLPPGYDITDWLQSGRTLSELPLDEVTVARVSLSQAKATVARWLHMAPGEDVVVDVFLGAIVANRFSGDPVWLFLVAPPGGIKTEILRTLSAWHEVYCLSTLTPSTLISGFVQRDGDDPSLLPKLNGLVLIIKDFTAVLDMPRDARQQILGDLRDAYDGQMAKAFGSEAGTRSYNSKFGLLAAVTPAIDRHWSVGQQLGERFLKLRIPATDTRNRVMRAAANSGHEERMRQELAAAMEGVLHGCQVKSEQDIAIEPNVLEKLVDLADCLAVLRSVVDRDGYSKAVVYLPEPEVGTRLVKQFAKLARGIAAVRGKGAVDDEEYRLVRRIARDTLPTKRAELVATVYRLFPGGFRSSQELADEINLPTETAKLALEDLWLLRVIEREGTSRFTWRMAEGFRARLAALGLFEGEEPLPDGGPLRSQVVPATRDNGHPSDISSLPVDAATAAQGDEKSGGRQHERVAGREQGTL